ncbi:AAA family ATPase [Colwellia sp. 1_MG-2023]|uniref:AAA family ATPase n=1 Tax=Colwellia sp. 1_MG-2023 TaxID=3062649 RepID=UPI0026E2ACDE|nr:AAA family ATPase [Colwellia sp. 1_MG-2023]MDO6447151.1 AAA family ATPase [Colwellia sp. 1_MG-2023]
MQTAQSTARQLASDIASQLLEVEIYDDDFIQELPRDIISKITGKPFKKLYGNCPKKKLRSLRCALTLQQNKPISDLPLDDNLNLLASSLDLPKHCIPLLKLCVLTTLNEGLYKLFDEHIQHWVSDVEVLVAESLNISVDELLDAIQLVATTSLFKQSEPNLFYLLVMPYALAVNLIEKPAKIYSDFLEGLYYKPTPTKLSLNDYPHIELQYVSEFLKHAVRANAVGVNILLYGESGTGKTELTKVLSKYAKANLVAVKASGGNKFRPADELTDGRNTAHLRLQHYGLMNGLFESDSNCCFLIDEVDDVFTEYLDGVKVSKEKLHSLLGSNTCVSFWITNNVEMLPDSVIRRMSYVLEIPTPPKHIKAEILSTSLKGLRVSTLFKNQLATIPDLTPAHVVNASSIARALNLKGKKAEECIEHHIDQCLSACGLQTSVTSYKPEMDFDSRFINLSGSHTKIEHVIDTVTNFTGARCLLLGAAGTGKSALVHHIAETLEKELITIKPSDVLSKYVGEAEQNIAQLFKQASECDAIIFLDEVDSVLTSRDITSELHQKQIVNQILIELDRTEQTVFAATNYSKNLDNAILRRFDFKLNFEYLTTKQVLTLYEESFGHFSTSIKEKLTKLYYLSSGDFAIAVRRNCMSKNPLSDSKNLEILTQENNRKIPSKTIGFVN